MKREEKPGATVEYHILFKEDEKIVKRKAINGESMEDINQEADA